MIGIAPSLSREMSDGFIRLAEEKGIPYQLEVMSGKQVRTLTLSV